MKAHILGRNPMRACQRQPGQQVRVGGIVEPFHAGSGAEDGEHDGGMVQRRSAAEDHQPALRVGDGQLTRPVGSQF
jgi:hypothetical protein